VIRYAESENVKIVYSADNKLAISEKQDVSIPPKDNPGRAELERCLRDKQMEKSRT